MKYKSTKKNLKNYCYFKKLFITHILNSTFFINLTKLKNVKLIIKIYERKTY